MTAADVPITPAFLRTLGFAGDESAARLEHRGPSCDGWAEAAVQIDRTPAGRVLTATVRLSNPTEGEFRRLCAAAGIEIVGGFGDGS